MIIDTFFNNQVKLLNLNTHYDSRGLFLQSYDNFIEQQIETKFVQENISISNKNVVRGLHYQWNQPMGKLVQCLNGSIIDIIVDIRVKSSTFGDIQLISLNNINKLIWIPSGFAHGFCSLEDNTIVKYMCNSYYNKNGEDAINILDTKFKLNTVFNLDNIIMSDKDRNAQSFEYYSSKPKF